MTYAIRPDYVANPVNRAREQEGAVYWTPRRIRQAFWYQWHVYAWARDIIRGRRLRTVLDVGCGPAVKFERLVVPEAETAIGIDQRNIIDYCRKTYAPERYHVDDFEAPHLEIAVEPDLVICCDVVEHLVDPDMLMAYLRRLSGPETLLLISTPDRVRVRGPDAISTPNPDHVREWADDEFRRYLDLSGFEVLEMRHLPPLKLGFNLLTLVHLLVVQKPGRRWRYNMAFLCRRKPT